MSDSSRHRHNNNHNISNSSLHARHPNPQDDLTWLDFLRTAGGTVPVEPPAALPLPMNRSDSSDRKRRHTGSESERRKYPYPAYGARPSELRFGENLGPAVGSSRETAVDLTASPRRPPRPSFDQTMQVPREERPSTPTLRTEGDMTLPIWQPDAEVTECPVCKTPFGFWYRKHHCRKCGRVVCANCSPHRITIPRQYIVQPPNPYEDEANPASPHDGLRNDPALGGGHTVRVCNPCVPDPWTPPIIPLNQAAAVPGRLSDLPPPRRSPVHRAPPPFNLTRLPRDAENARELRDVVERAAPERYNGMNDSALRNPGRSRAHTHQPPASVDRPYRPPQGERRVDLQFGYYPRPTFRQGQQGHRHSQSNVIGDRSGVPTPGHRPDPQVSQLAASLQPSRRREVKEEDECPVCGVELPPGEALREIHVRQCIETRFSSTPTQSPRPAPPAQQGIVSPPGASSRTPPVIPEGSRPRAASYRPRGMALYKATEKDCTTEDGEPQECVICFEEFETGDEMGRMECLCKFHRHCIRQWWDTKGAGSCPTHQLHD